MKFVLKTALLLTCSASCGAFAQNTPGSPDGILTGVLGNNFKINQHPDMPFAASAPSAKYQNGTSAMRKRGDAGDPDGCNLQCPTDSN